MIVQNQISIPPTSYAGAPERCVHRVKPVIPHFSINLVSCCSRPTPASFCSVFLSGIRKRKNVFQVTQYKTFQILVQTFPEPWARGSPSVFHFRNRQRFQVPGFEWVHELLLFCLASNPAQFCAEISCGKTELEHNCTISISRMKKRFLGLQAWGVTVTSLHPPRLCRNAVF